MPIDRKPRIALMGEFSAGKSSLTNLLLGQRPLPVQVTATRLPPVWISYGDEGAMLVDQEGEHKPLDLAELGQTEMAQARYVQLTLPCETLELCDLIDMPGLSDPNMPTEVWQSLLPEIDGVLWCTPATQAWRQSEAAFWDLVRPNLRGPATLLLTHCDKLLGNRDKSRVLRRLERETGAGFGAIFPLSLTEAVAAGEDLEAWQNSGADRFVEHLVNLLLHWDDYAIDLPDPQPDASAAASESALPIEQPPETECETRILPRRVRPVARTPGSPNRIERPHRRADRQTTATDAAQHLRSVPSEGPSTPQESPSLQF